VQCLHTSEDISHFTPASAVFSTNATCRHVSAPSAPVLSYDCARKFSPSSGTSFHSLHATSHALHPMHTEVSVKNPMRVMAVPAARERYRRWPP
jgi:hypothetical protein